MVEQRERAALDPEHPPRFEAVAILMAFSASGVFTAGGDTPRATAAIAIAIAGFALILAGRRET